MTINDGEKENNNEIWWHFENMKKTCEFYLFVLIGTIFGGRFNVRKTFIARFYYSSIIHRLRVADPCEKMKNCWEPLTKHEKE